MQVVASHHDDLSLKVFNVHVFNLQLLFWWLVKCVYKSSVTYFLKLMVLPFSSSQKVTVSSWAIERFDLSTLQYLTELICKVDSLFQLSTH